jgi:hypothetical protein
MKVSMYTMAVDSFVPMLEGLAGVLDKGAAHAKSTRTDLVTARLAPDMFPLGKQVQIACDHAKGAVARLMGKEPPKFEDNETTFDELKQRVVKTIAYIKEADAAAFEGAEDRDCSIPTPNNMVIAFNGLQLLRDWALPNFYFHTVTAYDILRHNGVAIGKRDYLPQIAKYARQK